MLVDMISIELHIAVAEKPSLAKNCRMGIRTAKGLARAFGTSHQLWMNLDKTYREHPTRKPRKKGRR